MQETQYRCYVELIFVTLKFTEKNITLCFCVRGSQLILTALMGPKGQNAVFSVSSLTLCEKIYLSTLYLWKILRFYV